MPTEPESKPPSKKRPRGKPKNDGFVVFEVDGFAHMTPEQKLWPVVYTGPNPPPKPADPKPADEPPPSG